MPTKVTDLVELITPASTDVLHIVDVGDPAGGSAGTSKKIKVSNLTSGGGGSGTVTSVALTAPAALSVSGSPVTTVGTIAISGAGTSSQYIDGTGGLQTTPTGTVTGVTATAPITSTGGATPVIDITDATTGARGAMSSTDKSKLDGIASGAEVNVNSDWNAVTGDAEILNKPTLTSGTVTSVAMTVPTAFAVSGSPVTSSGTLAVSVGGTTTEYIDGTGALQTFPTIPTVPVDSVNGEVGVVVLDTDDIAEGTTNLYYTEARVDANPDVVANTAKVGITPTQASDITTNNAKVGITPTQASDITTNNAKVGITPTQASDIVTNNAKVSNVQSDWNASSGLAVILNKPTIPSGGVTQIVAGTNVTISPVGGTGAVTVNASGGGGGGANNVTQNFSFYDSKVPVQNVFIPMTSESENTSIQRYGRYVCAYSGQVEKITLVTTASMSGGTGGSIEVIKYSGTTPTTIETVSFASMIGYQTTTLTFSSSSAFVAGDVLAFYLTNGFTIAYGNMSGQILFSVS